MKEKGKVCLLIPDGIGIRNYLYSDILEQFDGDELVIWHALPNEVTHLASQLHQKQLAEIKLAPFAENTSQRFLREAARYARLFFTARVDNNSSAFFHWMPKKNGFAKKAFYTLMETLGRWAFKKYDRVLWLEKKHAASLRKTEAYKNALETIRKQNITTILCTHQRSMESMPVMLAATDAGIKAVVAIFSWDNLPKATLFCRGNQYFVWSEYMKGEILKYYPEIDENAVEITGTPQFDFYRKGDWIETKEAFYDRFNIPADKKIICFSGDDTITSPFDDLFLQDSCKAVAEMNEAERPVILFRGVPTESSARYQHVFDQYPNIVIEAKPLWKQAEGSGWHLFYPTIEDLKLLVNLCYHSCGVINLGSTMGLDFAMFNRPTLYVKYNHDRKYPRWNMVDVYDLQHFKTLEGLDAVGWVNAESELLPMIRKLLEQPQLIGKDKLMWRKRITQDITDAGNRIGALLKSSS
ncbi:MAG: hypothetical protein V4722_21435 [Bacteroidota bacterium]